MEIGDYVRTNDGGIGKIIKCPFKSMYLDEIWGDIENTETIITNNVYKTSPNIIDLIECGDYVNGIIVTKVVNDIECNYIELDYSYNKRGIRNKDIKSIVTKEQFESMEYKIGE